MPAAVQTFFCHRVQLLDSANKTGLFMVLWCDWISVHQTKPISSRLWGECGFLLSSRGESRKRRRNVQHPHTHMRFSSVGSHNHSATVISVIPRGREKVGCLSVLDDSDDAQCTQHESCFFTSCSQVLIEYKCDYFVALIAKQVVIRLLGKFNLCLLQSVSMWEFPRIKKGNELKSLSWTITF